MPRAAPVVPLGRPFRLEALCCEACGSGRVTIVGLPWEADLPLRCWCSPDCARPAGWPFLAAEQRKLAISDRPGHG